MATHSSTLAWKIPWVEEPGGLQSMGSRRVGHDWTTSVSLSCIGEGSGNPLQCSCLENPRDRGAWWAAVYGVAQSRTRLKRLSHSSSRRQRIYYTFSLNFCSVASLSLFTRNGWATERIVCQIFLLFSLSTRKQTLGSHLWLFKAYLC